MTSEAFKLWQRLEDEVGSGEQVSLSENAILVALDEKVDEIGPAISELRRLEIIRAASNEELQTLASGKSHRGRYWIWQSTSGHTELFRVVQSPVQYRIALLSQRELFRRRSSEISHQIKEDRETFLQRFGDATKQKNLLQEPLKMLGSVDGEAIPSLEDLGFSEIDIKNLERCIRGRLRGRKLRLNDLNDSSAIDSFLFSPDCQPSLSNSEIVSRDYISPLLGKSDMIMGLILFGGIQSLNHFHTDVRFAPFLRLVVDSARKRDFELHREKLSNEIDMIDRTFRDNEAELYAQISDLNAALQQVESELSELPVAQPKVKVSPRESILKSVQRDVWRRDQGKCVICASQRQLHFDHVIPVIKGGSNTARNTQLLCETCNLRKGAKI